VPWMLVPIDPGCRRACPHAVPPAGRCVPMPKGDSERDPKVQLGKMLARARVKAGFTSQDALATALGYDRSTVTKAESGHRVPSLDVLAAWCTACKLDPEYWEGWAAFARATDGPIPAWFEDWLAAEKAARLLQMWSPILIPGLLQTPEYARAVLLAQQTDTSDENIDALVAARMERKTILDGPEAPEVVVVLDEMVLHRMIGSPQIMHDALVHLAELSRRPNVIVQVVPSLSNGANAGLGGEFGIATADNRQVTMYQDGVQDFTTENRSLVWKAAVVFDRVRGRALPCDASRDLILKVAEEKWKQQ
jgi:transcriptional regulator with XRE-family HTH domain